MMNKREEELKQKEFENDIARDLHDQEEERKYQEKMDKNYHPLGLAAIRFFGNLIIGYTLLRIIRWFVGPMVIVSFDIMQVLFNVMHVFIWGFAIISVITKKSPWERIIR